LVRFTTFHGDKNPSVVPIGANEQAIGHQESARGIDQSLRAQTLVDVILGAQLTEFAFGISQSLLGTGIPREHSSAQVANSHVDAHIVEALV
jgi:hypothetical protein